MGSALWKRFGPADPTCAERDWVRIKTSSNWAPDVRAAHDAAETLRQKSR
jgi:hypothetical protein